MGFLARHLQDHRRIYLVLLLLFLIGILAGSFTSSLLEERQAAQLAAYLDQRLQQFQDHTGEGERTSALLAPLKEIFLLWFLGLTVIGLPFIGGMVFWKGYVIGFTVSFLVGHRAWQGLFLALTSVFLPHLFYLPPLFLSSALACSFSLNLLKGGCPGWGGRILSYSLSFLLACLPAAAGGVITARVSPWLIKWVLQTF